MSEKKTISINIFVFVLCGLLVFGYWYSVCRKNVHNNGNGTDAIRNTVQQAADHNQSATNRTDTISGQRNRSEEAVNIALEELQTMKVELMLLKQDLENSRKTLERANKLLQEYEKEMKRKIQITKGQRGFAYSLFAGSIIYMAVS